MKDGYTFLELQEMRKCILEITKKEHVSYREAMRIYEEERKGK